MSVPQEFLSYENHIITSNEEFGHDILDTVRDIPAELETFLREQPSDELSYEFWGNHDGFFKQ